MRHSLTDKRLFARVQIARAVPATNHMFPATTGPDDAFHMCQEHLDSVCRLSQVIRFRVCSSAAYCCNLSCERKLAKDNSTMIIFSINIFWFFYMCLSFTHGRCPIEVQSSNCHSNTNKTFFHWFLHAMILIASTKTKIVSKSPEEIKSDSSTKRESTRISEILSSQTTTFIL